MRTRTPVVLPRRSGAGHPRPRDGGHAYELIDLHAIGFDPVFRDRDYYQFMHESFPTTSSTRRMSSGRSWLAREAGSGAPSRAMDAGKTDRQIVEALGKRTPQDVRRHQEQVAWAEGLSLSRRSTGWAFRDHEGLV